MNLVIATVKDWENICVKHNDMILWLHRQHDNFPGWIQPEGKVEPCESFFEAALWELKEEIGLTALNLQLKSISSFIKPDCYVYYDFLCESFEGELLTESREGLPK